MYYFDEKTGKYKRNYKVSLTTFFSTIAFCCGSSFFVYRNQDVKDEEIENLRSENEKLLKAFETINCELTKNREILEKLQDRDETIYRSILLPDNAQREGFKVKKVSSEQYEINLQTNHEIINEVKSSLEKLNYEMLKQEQVFENLQKMAFVKRKVWSSIPAILPVKKGRATSGFGMRMHPIYKVIRKHNGMDIANSIGTPIIATGDGVVSLVDSNRLSGLLVKINHGFGYETTYAHLHEVNVKKGMKVKRGQIIGYMGNTGVSTGVHVHYEIKKNGKPVNPISYIAIDITPNEYDEIMKVNNRKVMSMD